MLAALHDGSDFGQHRGGVLEHAPVVESHHHEAQAHQECVAPEIRSAARGIRMVRLTVALDEQTVPDEQIGAREVAGRQRSLRYCWDARLAQQNSQHAFRTGLGPFIGKRRGRTSGRAPLVSLKSESSRREWSAAERRVEDSDRLRSRQSLARHGQHALERRDTELGTRALPRPVETLERGTVSHAHRHANLDVQFLSRDSGRHPQSVMSER